jgi:site-specific recombinase XerC
VPDISMTTGRIKRNPPPAMTDLVRSRFEPRQIIPAPPEIPAIPPGPFGDLSRRSATELAGLVGEVWRQVTPVRSEADDRRRGAAFLLDHLASFGGETWQHRWEASGLDAAGRPAADLAGVVGLAGRSLQRGLRALFCIRAIRPSMPAFYNTRMIRYSENFRAIQDDPLLNAFFDHVDAADATHHDKCVAKADLAAALTVFGIGLADLKPQFLLYFSLESRNVPRSGGAPQPGFQFNARQTWRFLHSMGLFPSSVPETVREAVIRGQLSVAELVNRCGIRNRQVAALLIDYITRRAVDLDYSSLVSLARVLAGNFWAAIEKINPDQQDLRLDDAVYQQWKSAISVRPDGQPRLSLSKTLMAVRSFYLDLQSWAITEPERWAHWAAPCPIRAGELGRVSVEQRRAQERTAERTRVRQPLLPLLLDFVEDRHRHQAGLLEVAARVDPGEEFGYAGHRYRRTDSTIDRLRERKEGSRPVRVHDLTADTTFDVAIREDLTFWEWAVTSTLRHSGIRLEELTELTHLSLRQYQRPSGEVVALLVIAPSKTDRERVIPMSAELFATIAAVIRRQLRDQTSIPPVKRYDLHEKVWSDPLPFLFQRRIGTRLAVMATNTVNRMIRRPCEELATVHPAFAGLTFAPHDFRRLFATEIVNNGLPIHIGAALLGHLDTRTTRGYVAVFDDDLIRHYQGFLERRRSQRPRDEYRPATDGEWSEFEEHFDKRKVELGNCARPYGTPCQHEHACIRCPMLHLDPKILPRLDELESDLINRRARAQDEGWLGEIEGIDLTLAFLRDKRSRARRLTAPTLLGIPHARGPR